MSVDEIHAYAAARRRHATHLFKLDITRALLQRRFSDRTTFMQQILLIRPGTTEYDQQGRVQGTLDIPLCEDGRQEVEALVGELRDKPIAAVYSSPSQSAQQTAEALAATLDLKVKTVDNLENLDHGLWQG